MILTRLKEQSSSLLIRETLKVLDGIFFLNKGVCIQFGILFTITVLDKKLADFMFPSWSLNVFLFLALKELQGDVAYYTLLLNSTDDRRSLRIPADANSIVIGDLQPNTEHQIFFQVFNGAHSINSEVVHVTTSDGGWLAVNVAWLRIREWNWLIFVRVEISHPSIIKFPV